MGGAISTPGLIHVDVWQKPTQYCKAIILQLKINKFKKSSLSIFESSDTLTQITSMSFLALY